MENKETKYLEMIVKNIVEKEDEVRVTQELDEKGTKLTIFVAESDMGKVIGMGGKMAESIRAIMHAYGGKTNQKIGVVIDEPEKKGSR